MCLRFLYGIISLADDIYKLLKLKIAFNQFYVEVDAVAT